MNLKFIKLTERLVLALLVICLFGIGNVRSDSGNSYFYLPKGKSLAEIKSDDLFVQASLVKVLTAAQSLYVLGGDYRFSTKIYLTPNDELVIVGTGDPALTSGSLRRCLGSVVKELPSNKNRFERILLDNSSFGNDIDIPGRGGSSNPYDADVGAIAINYNSIAIKVGNRGVESGEVETPLTNFARKLGGSLKSGSHRIAIIGNGGAEQQFFELTSMFLGELGFKIRSGFLVKPKPSDAKLIGECKSDNLELIIKSMLKYSNNFSANQIFLNSGSMVFFFFFAIQRDWGNRKMRLLSF